MLARGMHRERVEQSTALLGVWSLVVKRRKEYGTSSVGGCCVSLVMAMALVNVCWSLLKESLRNDSSSEVAKAHIGDSYAMQKSSLHQGDLLGPHIFTVVVASMYEGGGTCSLRAGHAYFNTSVMVRGPQPIGSAPGPVLLQKAYMCPLVHARSRQGWP